MRRLGGDGVLVDGRDGGQGGRRRFDGGLVHTRVVDWPAVFVDGPSVIVVGDCGAGLVLLGGAHGVEVLYCLHRFLEQRRSTLLVDDEAAELDLDRGEAVVVGEWVVR